MHRLSLTLIFLFVYASLSQAQWGDVMNSKYNITLHGLIFNSNNSSEFTPHTGFHIFSGAQLDMNVLNKEHVRLSAVFNYFQNKSAQQYLDYGWDLTIRHFTAGTGLSFPIRKEYFIVKPSVHVVYMHYNRNIYSYALDGEQHRFRYFNGGGLKLGVDIGFNVKKKFDLGFHFDYSASYGLWRYNDSPSFTHGKGFDLFPSAGIFLQMPLPIKSKE